MNAQTPPRIGFVLSGGGARGAFQVGVYTQLLKDPRFAAGPTILSGTSAGAINAALIAAGLGPEQVMRFWWEMGEAPPVVANEGFLRNVWHELAMLGLTEPVRWLRLWRRIARQARDHFPPHRGSLSAWALQVLLLTRFDFVSGLLARVGDAAVFDTGKLRERLRDQLGGDRVRTRPGVRLAINTIDAPTGRVVRFVNRGSEPEVRPLGPEYEVVDAITVDMIVASASIPLLFPAIPVGNHLLWDGGVLVNTPLAPMVDLGADEVITVLVTEPPDPVVLDRFANLGDAIERVADTFLENTYNIDRKLLLERNRAAGNAPDLYRAVTLYVPIRPQLGTVFTAGSYLDFSRASIQRMYEDGRRATAAWLEAGPIVDALRTPEATPQRQSA